MSTSHHPASHRRFFGSALFFLILVNFVIFACQSAGLMWERRALGDLVELMQFGSLAREDLLVRHEYWRLLTYMFVHDVPLPLHVGLNMLMVFICGRVVQVLVNGWAVVKIYVLGGLLGGLAHLLVFQAPVVGASAAAYALLVAMGMLIPERRVFVLLGLVLPVRMRIKYLVWGIVLATIIFFFVDLIAGPDAEIEMISGIGHLAHLGGALAGYLYCKVANLGLPITRAELQAQRRASEHSRSGGALREVFPGTHLSDLSDQEEKAFRMTDIDPVLDKIVREGFLSLSQEERDRLQLAMRHMSRT